MMGASKLVMEMFLLRSSQNVHVSTARFANVAFSEGSLLFSFKRRIEKRQPLAAPRDVERYFMLPKESGELCLMSCLLAQNRDLFFPKVEERLRLMKFSDIAVKYLEHLGYEPFMCESEAEAREKINHLIAHKKWPCFFFDSDTTGEKDFESFYTKNNIIDWDKFRDIAVIKNIPIFSDSRLEKFTKQIRLLRKSKNWGKKDLLDLFLYVLPNFHHDEKHKFLDERM
jgi:FlaA1/EpsC-like NDP-sugar epimerase